MVDQSASPGIGIVLSVFGHTACVFNNLVGYALEILNEQPALFQLTPPAHEHRGSVPIPFGC